jgi:hypothetical protein
MKKPQVQKLMLSRESIRQLESGDLQRVEGGISYGSECTRGLTNCGAC